MEFVRSLRQLWRHRYFRRLLAVRVATQSGDGVLQIALASYVLFSPERQPDAASIATVLAITCCRSRSSGRSSASSSTAGRVGRCWSWST